MRTQFPSHLTTLVKRLGEINRHGIAALIARSDTYDRLTKKSRADKSPLPEWAEGLITLTYASVNLNHD